MYVMRDYDEALRLILDTGVRKENRTGVDALTVFCILSRYRIDEFFPLLTGRKIWPKSVFAELLWFLSGSTNNKDLQALGSNIWTPWVDEEFEKKHGYAEGCLGPVYGFQLRHFGGCYGNGKGGLNAKDYRNDSSEEKARNLDYFIHYENPSPSKGSYYGIGGFDQLERMVTLLKKDPDNRKNLFSLWNPEQLEGMRLPPCHYTFQVYVEEDRLSGVLTQRSCDFPIGVPANIQFYSALIYMLAQQTGYKPYELVHHTVDSHIYVDQIDGVEEYLSREKPVSPRLELNKAKSIDEYELEDFELADYNPLSAIKIPVAV